MPPPLRHPYIAIVAYYRFREIKKTEMRPCHNASSPRRGLGAQGGDFIPRGQSFLQSKYYQLTVIYMHFS
jgi:hypothetical protein